MTLAEGRHDSRRDRIDIVADMRVSWETEPPGEEGRSIHLRPQDAILKLIVSKSRERCLAFAGNVDPDGMDYVIRDFYEERLAFNTEVDRLRSLATGGDWDFLVAMSEPDLILKLTDHTQVVRSGTLAWIGETQAHKQFREELDNTTKFRVEEQMETALSAVIDSGAFASVGGLIVRVSTAGDGRFSYHPISGVHIGDADRSGLSPGSLLAVSMTDGPYFWSGLQCSDDYPAVGWWHPQSGEGYVSDPLQQTSAQPFQAESDTEAKREAQCLTGRPMLINRTFRGTIVL